VLTPAQAHAEGLEDQIEHVLLISVDGLHALDVARYLDSHPDSTMKQLAGHGITYSNARTPANSDSLRPRAGGQPHCRQGQRDRFRRVDRPLWDGPCDRPARCQGT